MKKTFTLMFGLSLIVALSSCSAEDKLKGYAEDLAQLKVERMELKIEKQKAMNELLEDFLDMDDDDFEENYEKMRMLNRF